MNKFCSKCGKELEADEKFCKNCGTATGNKEFVNENNISNQIQKPKKKKSGCLIVIIICFVIGFIIAIASIGNSLEENGTENKTDINTEEQNTNENTQNTNTESTKEIAFGTEGDIGNLKLVVNSVSSTDSISAAQGYLAYTPDSGKYGIVNVTIKNTTKNSEQLLINYFKLIGPDGAEYVATLIPAADDKFITIDTINPNLDITGNIVFEVPTDLAVEDCILKYSDYDLFSSISEFLLK